MIHTPFRKSGTMGTDERQPESVLPPVEQARVPFYGRELVAVRLADGRIAAVLRWLCEGMGLDARGQLQRIRRKSALRDELLMVRVETEGGPQAMPALTLRGLPGWLYTIDETRLSSAEACTAVVLFQREATDALSAHFGRRQAQLSAADTVVPSEPIIQPDPPTRDASREMWIRYHEAMAAWLHWQQDIETWQGSVESRLESHEALLRLVPELLERLGQATLTPEHQATVKHMAKRLNELAGISYATIYSDLNAAFHVGKYSDIPDESWPHVAAWLQQRIEEAEKRRSR
jgi:antirepressor protein